MDGNYRSTFDIRVPAADTIIFLDFPKHISLFRIVIRYLQNIGHVRSDIGGDNYDKVDFEFIQWIWSYPTKEMLDRLQMYRTHQRFVHLKSSREVNDFLNSI